MAIEGVDYSFSPPSVSSLVQNGKKFAVRYGGPGTSGKWLTASEYRALTAAGIEVVANAEGSASGFRGWNAGVSWATSAQNYFRGLGIPANRPIYFSADWDVSSAEWPEVKAALQGAASVIGAANVGLYAGRRPIEWARRDGVCKWFWQTYAWSGGYWVPGNHIEQYRNGVPMGGGDVDLCRALTADYGQWGYGDDVSADDVWNYVIDSPSLGFKGPAKEWLKYTVDCAKKADQTNAKLDAMVVKLDHLIATVDEMAELVRTGGGDVNISQILTGIGGLLQGWRNTIMEDTRDAIADANEAAAAAMREEGNK